LALLPEVRHAAPVFVDRVLEEAGAQTAQEPAGRGTAGMVEPLSERELEVLRLIAAGLANREIAEELYIAVGTVKRHINHIYGKLGVHSRTQALARARDLDLF
jgi:LuxR family maltose regulon positive regulatory protein